MDHPRIAMTDHWLEINCLHPDGVKRIAPMGHPHAYASTTDRPQRPLQQLDSVCVGSAKHQLLIALQCVSVGQTVQRRRLIVGIAPSSGGRVMNAQEPMQSGANHPSAQDYCAAMGLPPQPTPRKQLTRPVDSPRIAQTLNLRSRDGNGWPIFERGIPQ